MFKRNAFLFGAIMGTLCAAAAQMTPVIAQTDTPGAAPDRSTYDSTDGIEVSNCMVKYFNKTKIPAASQGTLTDMLVEEGMTIKKDDVIAIVDIEQAKLALDLKKAEELEAKLQAQNDVNKRDAVASAKMAEAEAKTYEDLYEKGAAPYWEMKKKRAEADRAVLRIELADLNEDTAMAVYYAKQAGTKLAEKDIEMRTVRAPFDGFIEQRIAQLGEWVQPGSPIVDVVEMDRLKIEGRIDALAYSGQIRQGMPVQIHIMVGGTRDNPTVKRFEGVLDFVSTDLGINGVYRLWATVANERLGDDWLIKPGMSGKMYLMPSNNRASGELY